MKLKGHAKCPYCNKEFDWEAGDLSLGRGEVYKKGVKIDLDKDRSVEHPHAIHWDFDTKWALIECPYCQRDVEDHGEIVRG